MMTFRKAQHDLLSRDTVLIFSDSVSKNVHKVYLSFDEYDALCNKLPAQGCTLGEHFTNTFQSILEKNNV